MAAFPTAGIGRTISLVCRPPPHVTLHSLQVDHIKEQSIIGVLIVLDAAVFEIVVEGSIVELDAFGDVVFGSALVVIVVEVL